MKKRDKPRRLADLLEPGFAEGYDQFREVVQYGMDTTMLPTRERAFLRFYELVSVAAIESLNKVEDHLEVEPAEAVVIMWKAFGAVTASVNAQAFSDEGKQTVRREMLRIFKEGYDQTLKALTEGIPEVHPL